MEHKISTPYGHILPLFDPSLFIVKWLCFKLKNRAFRGIQQYKQSKKLNFLIVFFARLVRDSFVYHVFTETWPKYVKKLITLFPGAQSSGVIVVLHFMLKLKRKCCGWCKYR